MAYEAWLKYGLRGLDRFEELPGRPEAIEAVLDGLTGVGDETRYDVWVALRTFYRWTAGRFGVVDAMVGVKKPRRRPKQPRTLDEIDVERLLWTVRGEPRDQALLLLLLDTGARIGEVAALSWADIGRDQVRLVGKTGARVVPVSPETAAALRRLQLRSPGPVWVSARGGALTVDGLKRVVRRRLAGVGFAGGPHSLRHTFGKLYVVAGGDLFSLQRVMGHANLSTTRRYVGLDLRDVAAQHARFSPIARWSAAG